MAGNQVQVISYLSFMNLRDLKYILIFIKFPFKCIKKYSSVLTCAHVSKFNFVSDTVSCPY